MNFCGEAKGCDRTAYDRDPPLVCIKTADQRHTATLATVGSQRLSLERDRWNRDQLVMRGQATNRHCPAASGAGAPSVEVRFVCGATLGFAHFERADLRSRCLFKFSWHSVLGCRTTAVP